MGYLQQHLAFSGASAIEEAASALPAGEQGNVWEAEKILTGLGFSRGQMEGPPSLLSGGYQMRLSLARVLVAGPDMLLLDEPNNYLDITSIRWLQRFLREWRGELMLITHDRGFMDSVVTHTVGIHRRKARKVEGSTDKLYAQIAQEEEVYEQTRVNDERRRKEIELFVSRFRAKARLANMVQSRVKMLAKMEKRDRLAEVKNLEFSFVYRHSHSKYLMNADGLTFSWPGSERPLIRDFSLSVRARDRICVIGKNGKGKTTLLKLLAGVLDPSKGSVMLQQNTAPGYYEQSNVQSLSPTATVVDEIVMSQASVDRQQARSIAGAMMFEGDDALKKIEVLSGGEKSRVILGKLLVTPLNLLLLDEPTNHLDMQSCDSLLEALDSFDGAIIMVTHNEMFLNALAERLIVFQDDTPRVFEGAYSDFLARVGWREDDDRGECAPTDLQARRIDRKELRRRRSELIAERSRELRPLEQRLRDIEDAIHSREEELKKLNSEMVEASGGMDGRRIADLSREIHRLNHDIEALFDELAEKTRLFDERSAHFDSVLNELDSAC